jgi:hypothetical protein
MGALAHPAMAVERLEGRLGDTVACLAAQATANQDILHAFSFP